jgi:two-component system osmolarity sensor histidine kinase EnvZ
VTVTLKETPKKVEVIIKDQGPGIPDSKIQEVFLPFYRINNTKNTSSGMGLGLTIVNNIITSHKGTIKLENISPVGLGAIISLPFVK